MDKLPDMSLHYLAQQRKIANFATGRLVIDNFLEVRAPTLESNANRITFDLPFAPFVRSIEMIYQGLVKKIFKKN